MLLGSERRRHFVLMRLPFLYDRTVTIAAALLLLLFSFDSNPIVDLSLPDSDRDGFADKFEQELLAKFFPRFLLSNRECDGLPGEFRPGRKEPQLLAKNGTIYGQASPASAAGRSGAFLEIHYYHLWNRDCGLKGHPLDVEHVSVLIHAESAVAPAAAWNALYWYAAAHEDTVCDGSHGVRASVIGAERRGPAVWISGGKHASFLSQERCRGGCGGDDCEEMRPLPSARLLNLGERGSPMNDALWVDSPRWPLAEKMKTDFTSEAIAQLDNPKESGIIPINDSHASLKAVILAGDSTADALATAERKTGAALGTADAGTGNAMEKAAGKVGKALKRAIGATWRVLSGQL